MLIKLNDKGLIEMSDVKDIKCQVLNKTEAEIYVEYNKDPLFPVILRYNVEQMDIVIDYAKTIGLYLVENEETKENEWIDMKGEKPVYLNCFMNNLMLQWIKSKAKDMLLQDYSSMLTNLQRADLVCKDSKKPELIYKVIKL